MVVDLPLDNLAVDQIAAGAAWLGSLRPWKNITAGRNDLKFRRD
jgi:hypothetical protein